MAQDASTKKKALTITVTSSVIHHGAPVPTRHTCSGENVSPALDWTLPPAVKGVASFAVICDDPDAPRGTFCHWVLYDLPDDTHGLAEALPTAARLANGARQGLNDMGKPGYFGPCPPPGKVHHYHFQVFALDKKLTALRGDVTGVKLHAAMAGHILATGELVGTFERK